MIFYGWTKSGKPIIIGGPSKERKPKTIWPYVLAALSLAATAYGMFR